MRTPLIAVLLCVLATAGAAQNAPQSTTPAAAAAKQATASARPTGELIKAAGAATHDQAAMPASPRPHTPADNGGQDHPGGLAMLLAGLALMLGIALRRFGTRDQ